MAHLSKQSSRNAVNSLNLCKIKLNPRPWELEIFSSRQQLMTILDLHL